MRDISEVNESFIKFVWNKVMNVYETIDYSTQDIQNAVDERLYSSIEIAISNGKYISRLKDIFSENFRSWLNGKYAGLKKAESEIKGLEEVV